MSRVRFGQKLHECQWIGTVVAQSMSHRWIFDVGGRPNLPYDLTNDIQVACKPQTLNRSSSPQYRTCQTNLVERLYHTTMLSVCAFQGVNIKALAPHIEQPKPTTDWHRCCMLIVYKYNDFIGKQSVKKTCSGNSLFSYSGSVNSIELSPGCEKVWVDDDDYWGDDDTTTWGSIADLPYDYQDDIAAFRLYDRAGLELVEDEASSSAANSTRYEWNATDNEEHMHKFNGTNGCWTCSPDPDDASVCFESADKEEATEAELAVCNGKPHKVDDDCHCNNRRKNSEVRG